MNAIRLKTEYLKHPIGLDIVKPQLFWNCAEGVRQTAYRIVCRDENENVLWDSGRVESSSMQAVYAGVPLASLTRVVWQVRLWDENSTARDWSECAVFEIGLLTAAD